MENMELILSLAGTSLSLLAACVTFLVKLIRSVKARVKEKGMTALLEAVAPLVEIAETLVNYSGAEKKAYVLTKVKEYSGENKIEFNIEKVSDKIEQLVELSKKVNKRT